MIEDTKINKNNFENLNYKLKVVDNFLSQSDYDRLCQLEINKNFKKGFMVYHNEINDNGIIKSVIDKKLLQELYKNYHSLSMEILKELCPEKLELYEYSDFTIIVTDKDSKFPIHDDTPNKLLSGVIYLAPENNSGTIFYNDKVGHGKTEIEWKTNRAVFFSRKERETWHSYEGDEKNKRVALVYNLMTTQIKKVFKIEKKNYFIGNLRWKLSPYIFRYLKIII